MRLNSRISILATVSVVVAALAYGPLLVQFFRNQWQHEQYQFFPFVIVAFFGLLWRSCSQSTPDNVGESRRRYFAQCALSVSAWALLALAYVAYSPWLALLSAILLVASLLTRVSGAWRVEYLWGIWAMLFLLVPLPMNRDQWLINKLQQLSSRLSSFFLDWLGVHHLMDGNLLRLPEKDFFVDEACSGIVSVMSVIACAVIYGIWRNRPPAHVIVLAVAGVAWATFMNVARITAIALAYAWWGVDWSSGAPHETLGLCVFALTFLALVSTDYLLVALLAPIRREDELLGADPIRYGAKVAAGWDWLQSWGAPRTPPASVVASVEPARRRGELWPRFALGLIPLLAFGTLAAAQLTVPTLVQLGRSTDAAPRFRFDRALALDETSLPERIGTLRRIDFEVQHRERDSIFGQHSRVYRYQDDRQNEYIVSCDFPFGPSWHDLRVCYTGSGWTENAMTIDSAPAAAGREWNFAQISFHRPEGNDGLLTYCVFNERGEYLFPPSDSFANDIWHSVERQYRSYDSAKHFQIQVWTVAPGPVDEMQAETARELLLAARNHFYDFVTRTEATTEIADR